MSLSKAVLYGQLDVVGHLLKKQGAQIDSLTPRHVAASSSSAIVIGFLVVSGWDINQSEPEHGAGPAQCLLQPFCHDESLVRCYLDHGASVEDRHPDPYCCPPVLEIVAAVGTVSTFALLHSRGAQLGPWALHMAVQSRVWAEPENRSVRMLMV